MCVQWALERIGSVHVENTEMTTIAGCHFTRIGGNGIMISAYNRNTTVEHSEFAWMGGSAIAAWVSCIPDNKALSLVQH